MDNPATVTIDLNSEYESQQYVMNPLSVIILFLITHLDILGRKYIYLDINR